MRSTEVIVPLLFLGGALLLLNVLVSLAIVRSRLFTGRQLLAQHTIVWLVPVLGAILVGGIVWSQLGASKPLGKTVTPGEAPGIDGNMLDGGGHAP